MQDVGYLLSEAMFDEDLREMVGKCLGLYHKHKTCLSAAQLKQAATSYDVKLKASSSGNHHFDKQTVLDFARYRMLRKAGVKFHDYLERGKFDRAKSIITEVKMPRLSLDDAADILRVDSPMARRENIIATGLEDLDGVLRGGMGAGDLAVVLAPTSGGKTSFLVFIGGSAAAAEKKVYHVSLEINVAEVTAKYRCRMLGEEQPTGRTAVAGFRKRWEKRKKLLSRRGGRIQVRHYAPGELSTPALESELPEDVDLLIVDYLDYLQAPQGGIGIGYEDLGQLSVELRRIGVERGIPVWTASQINRKAYEKEVAEVQDVEASIKKMQACTQALSINQSEQERKTDSKTGLSSGVLGIAKNTFGERFARWELEVHWGKCTFGLGDRIQ